ncbi:MAG TPA: S1/P1 nuclease [Mucilaginibacter sp.]|nr:S1/P1 nuclease [Mucilaginibacter sp.]
MIKLFVGGFPLDMDEQQLAELIAPHGDIKTVKLVRDKKTRVCKGYGFVEMADLKSAEGVILALNGEQMGDRQLTISIREEEPVKPVFQNSEAVRKKRPRRITTAVTGILVTLFLAAWGRTGHSTIGLIAANHLTSQAKAGVTALLGNESLADVASWADDNRDRSTSSWHFINVELGLSFEDFSKQVSSKEDVYTALVKEEGILADDKASREDRVNALKYVIHFVGDIHQPMHVSRAEDKGGNTIQVRYDGKGTNLHSLWDTKMLEHAGLSETQLAQNFDKATPQQIAQWQSDSQMTWAWESYQISTQLYGEISKNGTKIDDAYYQAHMSIVENRIEKAGIRLAGLLNAIFAKTNIATSPQQKVQTLVAVMTIKESDVANHIGETVKVCSKVYGHKDFGSMVLVNMGGAYPNSLFTVVLRGDSKGLADNLDGKLICVSGKVIDYKGRPEIVVTEKVQVEQ